jgi:hypothetical protein
MLNSIIIIVIIIIIIMYHDRLIVSLSYVVIQPKKLHRFSDSALTLILLTWRICRAPNNARKWQMGFNWVFKGLKLCIFQAADNELMCIIFTFMAPCIVIHKIE